MIYIGIEIRDPIHLVHLWTSCLAPAGWSGLLHLATWLRPPAQKTKCFPSNWRGPRTEKEAVKDTKQEEMDELLLLSRSQKPGPWPYLRLCILGTLSVGALKKLVSGIQPVLLSALSSLHWGSAGLGDACRFTFLELKPTSPKACPQTKDETLYKTEGVLHSSWWRIQGWHSTEKGLQDEKARKVMSRWWLHSVIW